ncbi:hypothetical protein PIB30_010497 [Stylosanthes scabra]|uniref:F-box domain-containing protein n=1 Tax=Stylosanthes scabra TaxID=79078 RepID=A0ABU6Q6B9_9FABA|nr:hypothetical protein [Stylosanthes scabra]
MNWQNPSDSKKSKERSSMSMEKQKSMNEILPLELIERILLSVPVKQLARLWCVSKLWHSLISDPEFVESHLHHSPALTHACLACVLERDTTEGHNVHLEQVFNDNNYDAIKEVSFPFKKKPPSSFRVMGSCRGFVLLSRDPHFLVVWNPLTRSSRRISYSCLFSRSRERFSLPYYATLYGFGYDESRDDYLVVLAWYYTDSQHHLDCFSLRTNSWINLNSALTKLSLRLLEWKSHGLFLNGSIHWLSFSVNKPYSETLLVFDLKERSFSKISLPEQLVLCESPNLAVLGGCLSFYSMDYDKSKTDIWVMKEYKVHSSWTLYEIPGGYFKPLCLSNGSDIVAFAANLGDRQLKPLSKYQVAIIYHGLRMTFILEILCLYAYPMAVAFFALDK